MGAIPKSTNLWDKLSISHPLPDYGTSPWAPNGYGAYGILVSATFSFCPSFELVVNAQNSDDMTYSEPDVCTRDGIRVIINPNFFELGAS